MVDRYVMAQDAGMTNRKGAARHPAGAIDLRAYREHLEAADRPSTTVYLRCYHVSRLVRDIPQPLEASTEDLITWFASNTSWGTETKRSYRASLRSYYGWAYISGRIPADPTTALPRIQPRAGMPRPAAEDLIREALHQAKDRERLMIMLGAQAGLRRSEIAKIHTRDVVAEMGGWSLRVHGKGRRERLVPLTPALARALRALPEGWAFPSPTGGHLTPAHVGKLISRALGPDATSHQLRHRFATRAYAVDHDLFAVQQLLGHSKPETTMIYTQLPAGRRRAIVESMAA